MGEEIALGEIVKPHGIKGAVKVKCYTESPDIFLESPCLTLRHKDGTRRDIAVIRGGGMGNRMILKLEGIDSREDAEALVGFSIVIDADDLPETDEDEYYWHDLIDMEVIDSNGKQYGYIRRILPTGSNDVYIAIDNTGRETLIPATHDAVLDVSITRKRMIIDPTVLSDDNNAN
jgi:16S rRNA processing protein RimM